MIIKSFKKDSVYGAVFWKSLERISAQVLNLVFQIILARLIAPEQFGQLATILIIITFLSIFVQSGVSTAVVQKKDLSNVDISTLLTSLLLISLLLYILLFILSPYISNFLDYGDLVWHIRIAGLLLFTYAYNSVQLGILMRELRFKSIFFRSVIVLPVSGIISVIMAFAGFGMWSLISFHLITSLLTCIVMFFCIRERPKMYINLDSFKSMFPFVAKIMGATVISSVNDLIRTIVIGKRYSAEEVAYYDKGLTYSNYPAQIVTTSMSNAMLPFFSKNQDKKDYLKEMCRKSASFVGFVSFPILLGFLAVSNDFVLTVFGEKWVGCIKYLMVYCLLRLPGCIAILDKQVYYSVGKSGIVLAYEVVNAIACILSLLVCIFVSPFNQSVMYIIYFTTIIEYLGFVCIMFISKKVFGYRLLERLKDLWKPTISAIFMAGVIYFISKQVSLNVYIKLFIEVFSGIILYFLFSLILRDNNMKLLIGKIMKNKKEN